MPEKYEEYIERLRTYCRRRNLSLETEKSYISTIKRFFTFVGNNHEAFTCQDVRDFLDNEFALGKKPRYINTESKHLKCLYQYVFKIVWDYELLPRVKFDKNVPLVLTKEEIDKLIDCTKNLKYKAIFAVMYSGGLRVSEAARLRYEDISRKNMLIHITKSKSRCDRYTILSKNCLDLLTEYWFACGKPTGYLFVSQSTGGHISKSTIENVFKKNRKLSGINPKASPHTLRHSFATHLLENGESLKTIQVLLGHSTMQITEMYLTVTNKTLMGVKSPYDYEQEADNE